MVAIRSFTPLKCANKGLYFLKVKPKGKIFPAHFGNDRFAMGNTMPPPKKPVKNITALKFQWPLRSGRDCRQLSRW
jgi:hypothetical protein